MDRPRFVAAIPPGLVRRLLPLLLMVALAIAVAPLTLRAGDPDAAPLCNGHRELCGRRFDQVVFAATHNSMSSVDDGYTWPFQDHGITRQLDDGVRMLLIDSHYWEPAADDVKARARLDGPQLAAFDQATENSPQRPGAFLCHALCALGSTPLDQSLTQVRQFLDTHPDEVMSIFLQDAVSPADTVAAFDRAGLTRYAYAHPPAQPWPTLEQMIHSGHRLVVFAEVQGPPPPWYMQGWEQVQDTSFSVHSPDAFDCALNRGSGANSLFLLNHWISKPVPSVEDAALVNSFGFLLRRAHQCERQRGQLPNFIAVNFYDVGDVFRVVNALNHVH